MCKGWHASQAMHACMQIYLWAVDVILLHIATHSSKCCLLLLVTVHSHVSCDSASCTTEEEIFASLQHSVMSPVILPPAQREKKYLQGNNTEETLRSSTLISQLRHTRPVDISGYFINFGVLQMGRLEPCSPTWVSINGNP